MHLSNQQLRDVPARPPCIADYVTSYLDVIISLLAIFFTGNTFFNEYHRMQRCRRPSTLYQKNGMSVGDLITDPRLVL